MGTYTHILYQIGFYTKNRELFIVMSGRVVRFMVGILIIMPLNAQLLFSEFMIDPDNDNTGEFIEIYNFGDSLVELSGFYVCDEQDTDIVICSSDSLLFPGCYGVVLDPDYAGEFNDLIPDSIPLFTIEDSRFGKYGISNSTSKIFSLLNKNLDICDSYKTGTPLWPSSGYSLERRSFNDSIWCESLTPRGTPGFRNSTAIKEYDLELSNLECNSINRYLNVSFTISNIGSKSIEGFIFGYIVDIDFHLSNYSDTLLFMSDSSLAPGDTFDFSNSTPYFSKGQVVINAFCELDGIRDSISATYFIPLDTDDLLITEFVCKTGDNFSSEYIEIISRYSQPIQLHHIEIHDLTGFTQIDTNCLLMPDSIIVLAQSASFHNDFPFVDNYIIPPAWRSLNNSEDIIRLQNPSGSTVIDLQYDTDWNIASDCAMQLVDIALDHNDPINWEISYSGSPGRKNETTQQLHHLSVINKNTFFTPLDTLEFLVMNDGYFPLDEIACTLRTPLVEQIIYLPASGRGDTMKLEIDTTGIFFEGTNPCTLECTMNAGGVHRPPMTLHYFKYYYPDPASPVFFNEIMFDPIDTYGQAEFIELMCSDPPLDLDHWKLKVNNYTVDLGDSLTNIYTALCDIDHPLPGVSSGSVKPYFRFPSLPNAGAELWLLDPMARILDYADLRDHDDISTGKSLEKQFFSCCSDDPGIWLSSVSQYGMTPGRLNSITALPSSHNAIDVYPQIFTPGQDDVLQFSIDSENPILFCELFCFNAAGQCVYRHDQNTFNETAFLHFWNGRINGDYLARGLYLVLAQLHDQHEEVYRLRETFIVR